MRYKVREIIPACTPKNYKSVEEYELAKKNAKVKIVKQIVEMLIKENYIKFTEDRDFLPTGEMMYEVERIQGFIDVNEMEGW